mmetsp:Transcript_8141/g.8848  ORF Transcript_8141/g.8848 Transcript_8141/m.8848 type:complete len:320 (+) Transcript_8141:69-1028(+)
MAYMHKRSSKLEEPVEFLKNPIPIPNHDIVTCLALPPDLSCIVLGGFHGTKLFDPKRYSLLHHIEEKSNYSIQQCKFSEDIKQLWTLTPCRLACYDVENNFTEIWELRVTIPGYQTFHITPNEVFIADDRGVQYFIKTAEEKFEKSRNLILQDYPCWRVHAIDDSWIVATTDYHVLVYDTKNGCEKYNFSHDNDVITKMSLSPDSSKVVAVFLRGTITLWNLGPEARNFAPGHKLFHQLEDRDQGIADLVWSPNDNDLISVNKSGVIQIWDTQRYHLLAMIKSLGSNWSGSLARCLAVSPVAITCFISVLVVTSYTKNV